MLTQLFIDDPESAKQYVKLHSSAIHIENKDVGLIQRKAFFYLVYKSLPFLDTCDSYQVKIAELAKAIGCEHSNLKHIKSEIKKLAQTSVSWNIFQKDEEVKWGVANLLADCEIESGTGICEYSFSPKFKKRFLNPDMYVKLNLIISKHFKSKHAFNIYVLALDYLRHDINYGEKLFSVEELRQYLGIAENEYKLVGDLHRRVVKRAIEEINSESDMKLEIELKRGKRNKIVGFKFKMSIKEEFVEFYKLKKKIDPKSDLPLLINEVSEASINVPNLNEMSDDRGLSFLSALLLEKLTQMGFVWKKRSVEKINQLTQHFKTYQTLSGKDIELTLIEKYIEFLSHIVNRQQEKNKQNGRSGNPAGLFLKILLSDEYLKPFIKTYEDTLKDREQKEKAYDSALGKQLELIHIDQDSERFKQWLDINYDQKRELLEDVFNKNTYLQKKNPKDKQSVLNTKTIVMSLYGEADKLGFSKEPFDSKKYLEEPEFQTRLNKAREKVKAQLPNY